VTTSALHTAPPAVAEFELTVLMYHYVRDPGDQSEAGTGIAGWPTAAFEAQLAQVRRAFNPVAWPDLQAHLLGAAALPPRACLLTFDDGLRDHYENVFPRLQAAGLSGLFFGLARQPGDGLSLAHRIHFLLPVLGLDGLRAALLARLTPEQQAALHTAEAHYRSVWTDPVDGLKTALQRELAGAVAAPLHALVEQHVGPEIPLAASYYLNAAQIAAMAAGGMYFGGHGQSHPWFDWVPPEQAVAEAEASAAWLRPLHAGPWAFAYPYGGFNAATPGVLAAAGFGAAFTTREATRHTSPFHIGRFDGESLPADFFTRPAGG
jgi:peptidoglycan/xylan/chitin deacetylase (PgdA/CDA1 family)